MLKARMAARIVAADIGGANFEVWIERERREGVEQTDGKGSRKRSERSRHPNHNLRHTKLEPHN